MSARRPPTAINVRNPFVSSNPVSVSEEGGGPSVLGWFTHLPNVRFRYSTGRLADEDASALAFHNASLIWHVALPQNVSSVSLGGLTQTLSAEGASQTVGITWPSFNSNPNTNPDAPNYYTFSVVRSGLFFLRGEVRITAFPAGGGVGERHFIEAGFNVGSNAATSRFSDYRGAAVFPEININTIHVGAESAFFGANPYEDISVGYLYSGQSVVFDLSSLVRYEDSSCEYMFDYDLTVVRLSS
jgi:hypothetical protein